MTAGQLLREARRRHGLTQAQLAARARTSQAAISRIERDVVSPTVETLGQLLYLMNEQLVLNGEPIEWGHDETLIQSILRRTPDERIEDNAAYARFYEEVRATLAAR
jgi:transcriptional regulator with XRE-family HTH domain